MSKTIDVSEHTNGQDNCRGRVSARSICVKMGLRYFSEYHLEKILRQFYFREIKFLSQQDFQNTAPEYDLCIKMYFA